MWKKGQASLKKCRNVVRVCKDVKKKAKIHLEWKLARDVKDNQKEYFSCIGKKGNTRESVSPLLNEDGALVRMDTEKVVTKLLPNEPLPLSLDLKNPAPGDQETLEEGIFPYRVG